MQGDFALLDQRDGDLYMDAGLVTCPADWSLAFDAGMSFKQWHSPVPMAHQMGVFDRALKYLLNMQVEQPVRRLNWTLTINPRLDSSPETFHEWGADRGRMTAENVGQQGASAGRAASDGPAAAQQRGDVQHPHLPDSMDELVTQPGWGSRLHRVLRDLPEPIADYKGMSRYRADPGRVAEPLRSPGLIFFALRRILRQGSSHGQ